MVNRVRMVRAWGVAVVAAAALTLYPAATAQASPSSAEECAAAGGDWWFDVETGEAGCTITDDGSSGDDGDSGDDGGAEPTCDMSLYEDQDPGSGSYADKDPSGWYCMGRDVCFDTELYAPVAEPDGPKPNEDAEARVRHCYFNGGEGPPSITAYWEDEDEPSIEEQARTALDRLVLPTPDLSVSPNNRTLVNVDTWFWAENVSGEDASASAFDVSVIATFRGLRVETGDGATLTCAKASSAEEAEQSCAHAYRRSSVNGSEQYQGRPAHQVSATAVYDLRFEIAGDVIDVPGMPATLASDASTSPLRVDEVQSRVTGVG